MATEHWSRRSLNQNNSFFIRKDFVKLESFLPIVVIVLAFFACLVSSIFAEGQEMAYRGKISSLLGLTCKSGRKIEKMFHPVYSSILLRNSP